MNKHTGSRKLSLKRETLTSMQNDELEAVQGGATPSVLVSVSIRVTAWSAKSSQQCAIAAGNAAGGSFSITKLFGKK